MAAWTLAPVCFGVGVVSWFDTTNTTGPMKGDDGGGEGFTTTTTTTTPLGVAFAMMGVVASSLYTVWIQWYHEKLECSSMQLLMNQAPISVLVMLYVIPVADDVTVWRDVGWGVYGLIGIVSFLSLFSSFFESPFPFGERQTKYILLTRNDSFFYQKRVDYWLV